MTRTRTYVDPGGCYWFLRPGSLYPFSPPRSPPRGRSSPRRLPGGAVGPGGPWVGLRREPDGTRASASLPECRRPLCRRHCGRSWRHRRPRNPSRAPRALAGDHRARGWRRSRLSRTVASRPESPVTFGGVFDWCRCRIPASGLRDPVRYRPHRRRNLGHVVAKLRGSLHHGHVPEGIVRPVDGSPGPGTRPGMRTSDRRRGDDARPRHATRGRGAVGLKLAGEERPGLPGGGG